VVKVIQQKCPIAVAHGRFSRICQLHSHLIHASLDPPESTSQTESQSVQPFLHSSWQAVPILHNGPPLSPSTCSSWC